MVEAVSELMTLEEFWDWYPDGYGRYELRNGIPIKMQPTGTHEQVSAFLSLELGIEIRQLGLPYLVARQAIVKPINMDTSSLTMKR